MTEAEQAYVEGLLKIANHPKVRVACEPCVSQPAEVEEWMVVRVLRAQGLLLSELNKTTKK